AELVADLAGGRVDAVKARKQKALEVLNSSELRPEDRRNVEGPIRAALAIADNDPAAFTAALERRRDDWAKSYRKASLRDTPEGLLDLWALALVRVGRGRGL